MPVSFSFDMGGFTAGVLAVLAAGAGSFAAYRIGILQAETTEKATKLQLEHASEAAAEQKRRQRRSLTYLLQGEVHRMKMESDLRLELVNQRRGVNMDTNLDAPMREAYKIKPREILIAGTDMPNLLQPGTCEALVDLLATVDFLNTQLEIRTQLNQYTWTQFRTALITIGKRADRAAGLLAEELLA